MTKDVRVGRVGALAVALGIGSAIAGMPGVAWAQPDGDNSSAGASQSVDAGSATETQGADEPSRGIGDENSAGSGDGEGVDDDATAATETSETRENTEKRSATGRGSAADDTEDDATVPGRSGIRETEDATDVGDTSIRDTGDPVLPTAVETRSAAEASTAAPEEAVDTNEVVDTDKATAPTFTPATVFASLFSPRTTPNPADTPETPPASPLLWTMLGYAKRHAGSASDQAGSAAISSVATPTGAVAAAAGSSQLPGQAVHAPVVAADGTVYQVTYGAGVTRVFILDDNAQVVADSGDITGLFRATGVTRPDGSLIVIAANDRGTRSTVYEVDSTGAVTTVRTVLGSASNQLRAGADGALYFSTHFTNPFDPFGANIPYRSFRISPTNGVRTFAYNTAVDLGPDGTAFLRSSGFGFSTLRVFGPTGAPRTFFLPYGSAPSDPIVGLDGTVYVTAGATGFFGTKTTRVYTFTPTSTTVRTVDGLPGDTVATPDGLYLETFTYSGSTDNGTGTTVISRITPTTVDASDVIDGRIAGFQVTPDGTLYAPLRLPSSATSPVAVVAADGSITTVTLPGTLRTRATRIRGGAESGAENVGYVNYSAGGLDHVAVLNPDGTIARTIDLPPGATASTVFFGPDGAAYQLLDYFGPDDGQTTARQILALATDTYTVKVPQRVPQGSYDVDFGPNGIGYLFTGASNSTATSVLGFDAEGNTVVPLSTFTQPVGTGARDDDRLLTFAPDGTAYVYNYSADATAGVYALTASGAVKVLDVDRAGGVRATGPVFTADGIGYVTFQADPGGTTVAGFSALSAL